MPQLDAATYRGQVFWLTVFFGGYYLIALNFFIPALAARLKARSKKAALNKGQASSFDGERVAALAGYDGTLTSATSWLSQHLTASVVEGQAWRQAEGSAVDAAGLGTSNAAYLEALSATRAQRLLAARLRA
jgi:hypothetical protein